MAFKCGTIALIGKPNVGKSTLLNALVGEKIAIVTAKPQTTRNRIIGIRNLPEAQLVFLDTPGLHKPHRDLNEYMIQVAKMALSEADLIIFIREPALPRGVEEAEIYRMIQHSGRPFIVVINKIDTVSKDSLLPVLQKSMDAFPEAVAYVPVSALKVDGTERLLPEIVSKLPEGPTLYPKDLTTDQTERFLVTELIREQIIQLTKEEIPYAVAITIDEFKEADSPSPPGLPARAGQPSPTRGEGVQDLAPPPLMGGDKGEGDSRGLIRISATIHVEKDSQKGILIGKGGQMIKTIGELSRKEIEKELGQKLFLKLFVKVSDDWSRDPYKLREFGYSS